MAQPQQPGAACQASSATPAEHLPHLKSITGLDPCTPWEELVLGEEIHTAPPRGRPPHHWGDRDPEQAPNARTIWSHQGGKLAPFLCHFFPCPVCLLIRPPRGLSELLCRSPDGLWPPCGVSVWVLLARAAAGVAPGDLRRAPGGAPALPLGGALLTQGLLGGLEVTLPPSCSFRGWFGAGF